MRRAQLCMRRFGVLAHRDDVAACRVALPFSGLQALFCRRDLQGGRVGFIARRGQFAFHRFQLNFELPLASLSGDQLFLY
ncbi:hypothetical protein D3C84_1159630 [compost metagenome]